MRRGTGILLAVALATVGCGGGDDGGSAANTAAASGPGSDASATSAAVPGGADAPTEETGDQTFTPGTVDIALDDLVGTFETSYGQAVVRREGDVLHAAYDTSDGTITFTLDEANLVLRGWWTQAPSRAVPDDAGELFLRATDSGSFTGEWRNGDAGVFETWNFTPAPEETPAPDLVARLDDASAFLAHP